VRGDSVITVVVVDDHNLVRQGIKAILEKVDYIYTLDDLCREFAKRSHIAVEYRGEDVPLLSDAARICFFSITSRARNSADGLYSSRGLDSIIKMNFVNILKTPIGAFLI